MVPSSARSIRAADGSLGQPGHGHHVAADQDDEARAGGQPDLADVELVAARGADRSVGSVEKEYCVLATHTGSAPYPSRLDALAAGAGPWRPR